MQNKTKEGDMREKGNNTKGEKNTKQKLKCGINEKQNGKRMMWRKKEI